MKKIYVSLLLFAFMIAPMSVTADVDISEILNVSTYNMIRGSEGLNYNATTGLIEARLSIRNDSWFNIGLGAVEMKFNLSCEPRLQDFEIVYNNETLEVPVDLLKNFTYIDGKAIVNWMNDTSYDVVDCKYLLAYFWLEPEYVDQPTENEWPMPLMGATEVNWADENNWTAPPVPMFALAEDSIEYPISLAVPVEEYVPLVTTTAIQEPITSSIIIILLVGGIVALVVYFYVSTLGRE